MDRDKDVHRHGWQPHARLFWVFGSSALTTSLTLNFEERKSALITCNTQEKALTVPVKVFRSKLFPSRECDWFRKAVGEGQRPPIFFSFDGEIDESNRWREPATARKTLHAYAQCRTAQDFPELRTQDPFQSRVCGLLTTGMRPSASAADQFKSLTLFGRQIVTA